MLHALEMPGIQDVAYHQRQIDYQAGQIWPLPPPPVLPAQMKYAVQ